jgi:mRNA interferase MazF
LKRGTIILTPFPFTDLTQNKVRPALVVSSDVRKDSDIIIAFISSVTDTNLSTDSSVILKEDDPDFDGTGLKVSSVIRETSLQLLIKILS